MLTLLVMLNLQAVFGGYKGQMCFGVLGDFLWKKWICVMRHFVIHSGSCRCLSSGVNSWLLHYNNGPAHMPLIIRSIMTNNNTVFTRLTPCDFFYFQNWRGPRKKGICYYWWDKKKKLHRWKSSRLYQKLHIRSASRIRKRDGKSVLYPRGINLKGQYRYWWKIKI